VAVAVGLLSTVRDVGSGRMSMIRTLALSTCGALPAIALASSPSWASLPTVQWADYNPIKDGAPENIIPSEATGYFSTTGALLPASLYELCFDGFATKTGTNSLSGTITVGSTVIPFSHTFPTIAGQSIGTPSNMFWFTVPSPETVKISFSGFTVADIKDHPDVHGEVLSVIPEPSTWAMMLLGFSGLGFMGSLARRRKRPDALAV